MLKNTFGFGVTNIPVYTNGQLVYTPAVNRILQLAANIYDASTNTFYPDVFRPIFEHDDSGNVYIIGYTNISSAAGPNTVTGTDDWQFIEPLNVEALTQMGPDYTPITEGGNLINVYGVPWIFGAKKNLPGFNQLSLINLVQVERRLQLIRSTVDAPIYTNHMYILSITNQMGASFWNSYSNDYSSPSNGLSVIVADNVQLTLTNSDHPGDNSTLVFTQGFYFNTNLWPGSHWSGQIGEAPANNSFITASWTNIFFSDLIYKTGAKVYVLTNDPDPFESNNYSCDPLPQMGLITTNWLRAIILDNGHVVDYVQIRGPTDATNITTAIADPNTTTTPYLWSTNDYGGATGTSWGYVDQILMSEGFYANELPQGQTWQPVGYPGGSTSIAGCTTYFRYYFTPMIPFIYDGYTTYATNLVVQAGYTATRTIVVPYLFQVNDPLVHYLVTDLNANPVAYWHNGGFPDGVWEQNNGVTVSYPVPISPYGADIIKGRYQPWGLQDTLGVAQSGTNAEVTNGFALALKDPLVWDPDYWDFPTNLLSDLTGLGQVHRGTPWQTVYLKSDDVLNLLDSAGDINSGTNTWVAWTGDNAIQDAAIMAPVNDWPLASLLISLLNTNDIFQLMSVNDPNTADWLNVLNGLTVSSNSITPPNFILKPGNYIPSPAFDTYVMGGDSAQAETIAIGIAQAKAVLPNQIFNSIGDIISAPELTVGSPWLDTTNLEQTYYGITDAAYEAIPAQLLFLLRPDSVGALSLTNGCVSLQFSGSDGYSYEVQQSSDLLDWTAISTNCPVQGVFNVQISSVSCSSQEFYRSVLLP